MFRVTEETAIEAVNIQLNPQQGWFKFKDIFGEVSYVRPWAINEIYHITEEGIRLAAEHHAWLNSL